MLLCWNSSLKIGGRGKVVVVVVVSVVVFVVVVIIRLTLSSENGARLNFRLQDYHFVPRYLVKKAASPPPTHLDASRPNTAQTWSLSPPLSAKASARDWNTEANWISCSVKDN